MRLLHYQKRNLGRYACSGNAGQYQTKIQNDYPGKGQVYTLCEFVNGSKEIPSVYGQTQEQYEQMYELIQGYVKKLANKLNEEAKNKCQMYT